MKLSRMKKARRWAWWFGVSVDDVAVWLAKRARLAKKRRSNAR